VDFGRLVTAMATPLNERLEIDWDAAGTLIDELIEEQQTDGLVICGTTGESPTLSDEEKLAMFEYAVKRADGRCKIIAGTGSNDTAHSVSLSQAAERLGVDGLLLVNPYYNRPTQEGLYEHFRTIAESVTLPLMLYNIPSRTGVNMTSDTTLRLAQLPNIAAVKESSGDLEQMTRIIASAPEGFRLYSGDDSLTLPVMSIGGYGIVSVASHVAGKEIKSMLARYLQGDTAAAARIHGQLAPLFKALFVLPNPVPVKYVLSRKGICGKDVRLPLLTPSEEEQRHIDSLIG